MLQKVDPIFATSSPCTKVQGHSSTFLTSLLLVRIVVMSQTPLMYVAR